MFLQEEDESKMHDTDLDVDKYTSMSVDYSSVQPGSQQIERYVQYISCQHLSALVSGTCILHLYPASPLSGKIEGDSVCRVQVYILARQ